jgi:hypothetical protein
MDRTSLYSVRSKLAWMAALTRAPEHRASDRKFHSPAATQVIHATCGTAARTHQLVCRRLLLELQRVVDAYLVGLAHL